MAFRLGGRRGRAPVVRDLPGAGRRRHAAVRFADEACGSLHKLAVVFGKTPLGVEHVVLHAHPDMTAERAGMANRIGRWPAPMPKAAQAAQWMRRNASMRGSVHDALAGIVFGPGAVLLLQTLQKEAEAWLLHVLRWSAPQASRPERVFRSPAVSKNGPLMSPPTPARCIRELHAQTRTALRSPRIRGQKFGFAR